MDFPFIYLFNMVIRYNCSQFQSWDGDRAKRTVWRSAFSQFTSHMAAWDGILPCRLSEQTFQLLSVLFKEPTVSDAWLCGAVLCAENPRVHKEHVALMPCLSPFGLTELVFSYRLPLSTTPSQFTEELWAQVTYPKSHMSGLPEFIPQNCHGS